MENLSTFLTIVSWVLLVLSILRVIGIGLNCQSPQIRMLEAAGANPIGDALAKPVVCILISIAWIISTYI